MFELNDLRSRYLECWFILFLTLFRSRSLVSSWQLCLQEENVTTVVDVALIKKFLLVFLHEIHILKAEWQ